VCTHTEQLNCHNSRRHKRLQRDSEEEQALVQGHASELIANTHVLRSEIITIMALSCYGAVQLGARCDESELRPSSDTSERERDVVGTNTAVRGRTCQRG
jgi:hypothetical protein